MTESPILYPRIRLKALLHWIPTAGVKHDLAITVLSEGVGLILRLLLLRHAAKLWNPEIFGEFIASRRAINYVYLPVLCGMGIAIAHRVATVRATSAGSVRAAALGALSVVGALIVLTGIVMWLSAHPLARLLFAGPEKSDLVLAVYLGSIGLVVHGVAYGLLRGMMEMRKANAIQLLSVSVAPYVLLYVPNISPEYSVGAAGVIAGLVGLVAIGVAMAAARHHAPESDSAESLRIERRHLIRYGLPRLPGEFALGALLAIPVTFVVHRDGLAAAGVMGVCLSLLALIGGLFAPVGQVVMPRFASHAAREDHSRLARERRLLIQVALGTAAFVGLLAWLLAPTAVHLLVPTARSADLKVSRIIASSAPGYVVYVLLRAIPDGLSIKPLNAGSVIVALLISAVIAAFHAVHNASAWGTVVGVTFLGGATLFHSVRVVR